MTLNSPLNASTVKPPSDSEFVLDDGLDEEADDDLLAFETERTKLAEAAEQAEAAALTPQRPANQSHTERVEPPAPPAAASETESEQRTESSVAESASTPSSTATASTTSTTSSTLSKLTLLPYVELDVSGLPVGCNRTHLEALLGSGTLRSIRLGAVSEGVYGPTILEVSREAAERVLALREPVVRGQAVRITERTAAKKVADAFAHISKHIPMDELKGAFQTSAQDAQRRFDEMNEKYELSAKATAAVTAAATAAKQLDEAMGASKGATAVAEAASVAAKEVDESWRVSERAREALNTALADERTAPAARMLLGALDTSETKPSRKDYTPTAERRNPDVVQESAELDNSNRVEKLEF